jgi:hypothetical protein
MDFPFTEHETQIPILHFMLLYTTLTLLEYDISFKIYFIHT